MFSLSHILESHPLTEPANFGLCDKFELLTSQGTAATCLINVADSI